MPFIYRDNDGKVIAIYNLQQYKNQEYLPDNHKEILNYGKPNEQEIINAESLAKLQETDYKIIREYEYRLIGLSKLADDELLQLHIDRQALRNRIV